MRSITIPLTVLVTLCGLATSVRSSAQSSGASAGKSQAAARAFEQISTVLSSPRCANCHIAGDAPLQGDDSHRHTMNVKRGPDGRGTAAMRCTNCHQDQSTPALHAPPGAPGWRLPPADMPMAWRGLAAGEQCRMLKDAAKNGHRTLADLLEHAAHDKLVQAGWNPGPGRTPPPLSHDAFVEQFKTWIDLGAACPE